MIVVVVAAAAALGVWLRSCHKLGAHCFCSVAGALCVLALPVDPSCLASSSCFPIARLLLPWMDYPTSPNLTILLTSASDTRVCFWKISHSLLHHNRCSDLPSIALMAAVRTALLSAKHSVSSENWTTTLDALSLGSFSSSLDEAAECKHVCDHCAARHIAKVACLLCRLSFFLSNSFILIRYLAKTYRVASVYLYFPPFVCQYRYLVTSDAHG